MHTEKPAKLEYSSLELHAERVEHRSISFRALTLATVGFAIFAIIMFIGLMVLFRVADQALAQSDPKATALDELARNTPQLPPPGVPRLQGVPQLNPLVPQRDLVRFKEEQAKERNATGPTTREGFVRIPVDAAVELVIENKLLKERPAADTQPAGQTRPAGGADDEQ
jgi:hypothetical protein